MRKILSAAAMSVALAVPAARVAVAHDHQHPMPKNLDTATTKLTENKRYRVSIAPRKGPAKINVMHAWVLTLATPDGKPVEGATIAVNGGMPAHGHGLPTAPRVTRQLGGGKYLVEGMKFNMAGWWQLTFSITKPKPDTVTFNLVLE